MISFILGTGRCGSTLVHEVLCRHPDVAFVSNLDNLLGLKGRWNNPIYRGLPDLLSGRTTTASAAGWGEGGPGNATALSGFIQRRRLRFAPSEGYRILSREVSPILDTPPRDLDERDVSGGAGGRLRGFFQARLAAQRRSHLVHHFTGWPRARLIHAAIPEARYVHVIRDGRAVAASLVKTDWWRETVGALRGPLPSTIRHQWERSGRSPAVLAGLQWRMLMEAFQEARAAIPAPLWHEVRFEDLLDDPRARIEEVMEFLELRWDRRFEEQFRRHRFSADRGGAYRRDLSAEDIGHMNRLLGDHLGRLGYALDGSSWR